MTHPERIGRFRVLGFLGRGAMGVVYRGRDDALERSVALKVMSIGLGADTEARARFLREARAAARLQHPNIVTVYELGEHEGQPFIAMELLEGIDLQRAIEAGIRPDPRGTFPIVLQVLAGLGHAHEKGIVHRDVKPSNIFLPRGLPAKITDFGVARLTGSTSTSGSVSGTPTYMSPEQVRGGLLDGRSDLFSTGLILYELVTGERAYRAESVVAVLYKIAHEEPDLSLLPRGSEWESLRSVITRALARDPEERFPDARSMATELGLVLKEQGGEVDWAAPSDMGLLIRSTPRPTPAGVEAPPGDVDTPTHDVSSPLVSQPDAPLVLPGRSWPPRAVTASVAAGLAVGILVGLLYVFRGSSPPTPTATVSPSATPSDVVTPTPSPRTGELSTPTPSPKLTPSPTPSPTPSAEASPTPTPSPSPSPTPTPTPTPHPTDTPTPVPETPSPAPTAPSPAEARLERAEVLLQAGRFQAALAEAKAVLAREPGNLQAKTLVEDAEVELVVEASIREAGDALKRGDKETALAAVKRGLAAKKNDRRLLELFREAVR